MRENNRKPIEIHRKKLPQFTTMNVIDGQAGLISYSSLIFYRLTIDNILNIIVLLILAGVSIATLTGENGILTRANDSKTQTEIADEKEAIQLAYAGAVAEKRGTGDVTADDLNREFGTNGTNAKAVDNGDGTITVTFDPPSNRVYTIDSNGNITEKGTGEVTPPTTGKTDGSFDAEKGVNTPKLGNDMELVVYDEETQEWVKDETNSAYSYKEQTGTTENEGTSEWANAKVTKNGVESYFVWIPRYEYKIDEENKTIDVKFIPTTQTTADEGYIIHPAFTTDIENGGWTEELSGLWIGKYEASRSDAGTTSNDIGSSEIIQIQPNVTSWRSTKIGDMYNYAKAYATDLKSHMLKNSEWGAVAYLTHSKYGRNGTEVIINNNSNYLTGNAGNSVDASSSATTNTYNTEKGVLASSTGNVYGIYDLSGGVYEYVASYCSGSTSSNLTNNGSQLVNETNREYVTAYAGSDVDTDYKQGDATKETEGWNDDSADFVFSAYPFFRRGGYCLSTSNAGVFNFSSAHGGGSGYSGFRVCLAV